MGLSGRGRPASGADRKRKTSEMANVSIISRCFREVRLSSRAPADGGQEGGERDADETGGTGTPARPEVNALRKDRDFALDAAARARHSAHRKVGPVGRHNPTGTTNRL